MSDTKQPDENKPGPVRRRYCPGCKTELHNFYITARAMPIEQYAIPQLRSANRTISMSVRAFGQQNVNELQFLCFGAVCQNCSLISTWDFGKDELEAIVSKDPAAADVGIKWTYQPTLLRGLVDKADEPLKSALQRLIVDLDRE